MICVRALLRAATVEDSTSRVLESIRHFRTMRRARHSERGLKKQLVIVVHCGVLLICAAMIMIVLLSFRRENPILIDRKTGCEYLVYRGTFVVETHSLPANMFPTSARFHLGRSSIPNWSHFNRIRFSFPLWVPSLLLLTWGVYPFLFRPRYRRWREHQRQRRGLCVSCGYDLRGLPEPRCPECGGATKSQGKEDCEVGP